MSESTHEGLYRRYRRLEHACLSHGIPLGVLRQALRQSGTGQISIQRVLATCGMPSPKQWEEAAQLSRAILALPDGMSAQEPFADVYQAALSMTLKGPDNPGWLYRGQSDHRWLLIPSMYRPNSPFSVVAEERKAELQAATDRVCGLVRQLQTSHPSIPDEQGVAMVQHYSDETKCGTWLIDLTRNPFIALHFASKNGQEGRVGAVHILSRREYVEFSACGKNRLGALRLVEPGNVARIRAQEAVFLDTSHPQLCAQLSNLKLFFKQRSGVVFADEYLATPVTPAALFPENDGWREEMSRLLPQESATPLNCMPGADAGEELGCEEYEKLALSWCEHEGLSLDQVTRRTIRVACEAYVEFLELGDKIASDWRNLHRLRFAVRAICGQLSPLVYPHVPDNGRSDRLRTCWMVVGPTPPEVEDIFRRLTRRE